MTAVSAFTDTWRLLLRAPLLFLTIGLVGYLIIYAAQFLLFGAAAVQLAPGQDIEISGGSFFTIFIATLVFQLALPQVLSAILHLAAWDVIAGRRPAIGDHIKLSVRCLPQLVLLSMAVGLAVGFGALFLLVPGLYLGAALSVVIPAIVIGGAGFGGLGRSWEITAEYRWTILGGFILVMISSFAVSSVLLFVAALVGLDVIAVVLSGAVSLSLLAIFATHVYATLGGSAQEHA
ncbi:MAG: hypothetical protein AAGJ96_07245 [Pseudomonadota bacterium]